LAEEFRARHKILTIGDFEKDIAMTSLIEVTTAGDILAFQFAPNPLPKFRSPVDAITKHLLDFLVGAAIPTDNRWITEFKRSMYKLGVVGLLPTLLSQMTDDSFWHGLLFTFESRFKIPSVFPRNFSPAE